MKKQTTALRRLISSSHVVMPGAFNAATGRLVEQAGFDAVYISGAGLANATAGVPDIGLLGLDEVIRLAGYIAQAVSIPALVDADTGFGGPANAARSVREFERAGLAGLHIEDQAFPKRCGHLGGKELISTEQMCEKIAAACKARRDKNFLIVARTDARAIEGLDGALRRAAAYLEAGADAIFPEALQTSDEFAQFASRIKALLIANMTEFGKSPLLSADQLFKMGYRIVLFPQSAFRVAMKSMELCLGDLKKKGTQKSWIKKMQSRQELYDLLDYDPKKSNWP